MAKVPLKATPLRMAWCPEAKLVAMITQRPGPYRCVHVIVCARCLMIVWRTGPFRQPVAHALVC